MRRLLDLFRRPRDPRQLVLVLEPAGTDLAARLGRLLEGRLARLVLTRNRSTLLSSRWDREDRVTVRLHESFANADEPTLAAVAVLCLPRSLPAARARARALVRTHAQQQAPANPSPARPRRPRTGLVAQGAVFDLAALRDEINRDYFGGRLDVGIGWSRGGAPGAARRRTGRRSLHLGTWSERDRLVRIHPVLDHPSVPREVVAAVVHHELLHAELGAVVVNGRRRVHTPEFRRREREFAHFEDAERWVGDNFADLVRRRRELQSGARARSK